ncbi:hypothetical protein [Lichenifustis flavocetrariae]|uniref:Uncharacterized protein n=1 Tax=Lichenifustis flavocetrariae TaxID=2949735 RepID=A0AA41Z8X4_9HYPH|nr:hypothetical protein [Lichenifustis flavocetrariae]MCW6511502.1 hypothetical protein [Lichenifustis flavocetrariae]
MASGQAIPYSEKAFPKPCYRLLRLGSGGSRLHLPQVAALPTLIVAQSSPLLLQGLHPHLMLVFRFDKLPAEHAFEQRRALSIGLGDAGEIVRIPEAGLDDLGLQPCPFCDGKDLPLDVDGHEATPIAFG